MSVVEIYKASDSVEAHLLCQALEEEGIDCQTVGDHVESLYGLAHAWNRPGIVVSQEDERRAREVLATLLGTRPEVPRPSAKIQYGLRALLVNFMLVAAILALYRPLGPAWPHVASAAFLFIFIGNLLVVAYVENKRHRILDGDTKDVDS